MLLVLEPSHVPVQEADRSSDAYECCFALSQGTAGYLVKMGQEQRRALERDEILGLRQSMDQPGSSQYVSPSSPAGSDLRVDSQPCKPPDSTSPVIAPSPPPNETRAALCETSSTWPSTAYDPFQAAPTSATPSVVNEGPSWHAHSVASSSTLQQHSHFLSPDDPFHYSVSSLPYPAASVYPEGHVSQSAWPHPLANVSPYVRSPQPAQPSAFETLAMPFVFPSGTHAFAQLQHPSGLPTSYDYQPPSYPMSHVPSPMPWSSTHASVDPWASGFAMGYETTHGKLGTLLVVGLPDCRYRHLDTSPSRASRCALAVSEAQAAVIPGRGL